MKIKSYEDIFKDLKNSFLATQDKVTDFNSASIIRAIFESVATEEYRKYLETDIGYITNLNSVPTSIFNFKKKSGSYATGTVIFSRKKPIDSLTVIPKGTVVVGGQFKFLTTKDVMIQPNEIDSLEVAIVAENSGTKYNLQPNVINSIESSVAEDVTDVRNSKKTTGGTDEESDNDMLSRFKVYINGLQGTSIYGLKNATLSIDGVRSVSIIEHFDNYTDSPYHATVYAEDGTGNLLDNLKSKIENIINGDGSPSNPGKKAPGTNIEVKAPSIVYVNANITCYCYRVDKEIAQNEIEEIFRDYINNLTIGEDVILTTIISELRKISYLKDVEIISMKNDRSANVELSNIKIDDSQIARFESCQINIVDYKNN